MAKNEKNSDVIDLRDLFEEYARKWYLFIICIVCCVGLAWVYSKVHQPEYQIKANILISQDNEKSGNAGIKAAFGDLANMFGSQGLVDDEVYLVSSHTVLRDAIKELGVNKIHYVKTDPLTSIFRYKDYPVDVFCNPEITDTLMQTLKFKVKVDKKGHIKAKVLVEGEKVAVAQGDRFPLPIQTPYGEFILNSTPAFVPGENLATTINFSGYHVAAELLSEVIQIKVANKRANVIALGLVSSSPEYAKDVLNSIIRNYNERGINDRNLKSQKTGEFLESRLALLSGDLAHTEDSLQNFKRAQGMTDLDADILYHFTKKGEIEKDLISSQAQTEVFNMLYDFVSDPANEHSLVPSTAATNEAQEAINAYNTMLLQRMNLARNARGNSIPLQQIDDQLRVMRENVLSSLDKGRRSSNLMSRELQTQINASDARLGRIPSQERIYRGIVRERDLKEQLFLFLLQRREETSMTLANSVPKGIIVDEAFSLSEPMGMTKKVLLALAFVLGLLLAPIIIYLQRLMRNKFQSKDELEKLTDIPLLGEVCTSRSGETLVVKPGGSTSVAELFRLIRTNLQFVLNGVDDKVILMTSTVSGEGKSFISINLASSLALLGKKVLLVGMDIRAPKLADYLPLQPKNGLTEYLSRNDLTLDDIILHDPVQEGMDIIVSGPVPPNPSELLLSKRVDELFEQLRGMYDYIIVDSAPVGMVSDSFALARISDATVYVCRAKYTTLRDVRFFNDLYEEGKLKKMSLVVNGTDTRRGYGYGYGQDAESSKKGRKK